MLKIDAKKTLLIIFSMILVSNLAIYFDVPFVRPFFGLIFLVVLPGLLLMIILKLRDINFEEKVVLLIGLSISFLMIYGIAMNNLLLYLGFLQPLSANSLLLTYDIGFVLLMALAYRYSGNSEFKIVFQSLTTYDKAFMSVAILFPFLTILGTSQINSTGNNTVMLFTLLLIPVYIAGICLARSGISNKMYPISVYSISISLLMIQMLSFSHIMGHDVHYEFYIFKQTLSNMHWSVFLNNTLDSTLSISLLPSIFQSILHISEEEFLFKGIYVLIGSFCPLAVYVIVSRYVDDMYAFLASVFFMSQQHFLDTAGSPRTSLAIFFVALLVMVLFDDRIPLFKGKLLYFTFIGSVIVSHYSTTYIIFILLTCSYIVLEILSGIHKFDFTKKVQLTTLVIFFSLLFLWYSQITSSAFKSGVRFFEKTLSHLGNFFAMDSRSAEYMKLAGQELSHPLVSEIELIITLGCFTLIALGVFTMILRYRNTIDFKNIASVKLPYLKTKFDVLYVTMAIGCSGLLVFMVVAPFVSIAYDTQRLFSLMMVVLSVCLIIGSLEVSKRLKIKPYLLLLIFLLPYFLFYTGTVNEVLYKDGSLSLDTNSSRYDLENVYETESVSAKWLKSNINENAVLETSDSYTRLRLVSQGPFPVFSITNDSLYYKQKPNAGYIYLGYNNLVNGLIVVNDDLQDINEYEDVYAGMNKIYSNRESEIYYV